MYSTCNSLDPMQLVQLIHFHCPVLRLLHLATVSLDLLRGLVQWQCAVSVLHSTEFHVHQQEYHNPGIIILKFKQKKIQFIYWDVCMELELFLNCMMPKKKKVRLTIQSNLIALA